MSINLNKVPKDILIKLLTTFNNDMKYHVITIFSKYGEYNIESFETEEYVKKRLFDYLKENKYLKFYWAEKYQEYIDFVEKAKNDPFLKNEISIDKYERALETLYCYENIEKCNLKQLVDLTIEFSECLMYNNRTDSAIAAVIKGHMI